MWAGVMDANDQDIPEFFTAKPKRRGLRLGRKKSNVIVRNAGHIMPFPVNVAFEKFSDFSRHSEWNPSISSATYIDDSRTKVRWTRETMGFTIGWSTITTVKDPNKALAWKSIEGIKLENRVIFQSVDEGKGTLMIMSTNYKVPEKVFVPSRKVVGKSKTRAYNNTYESDQMKEILVRFGEIVAKELKHDEMYFL
ncbi:Polyketide cyclase / dehydrase and lipid transport [Seminavis robusta]|uniref:Polyketide cyclase / dehydrase and lipid transport n=1 Tax=Seminavis robusta TaxID=568900 RepID=A0A9N8DFL5_9STRA|nr:Polyketide cyclase / dehydrase and lipid transport [Seminavis robusta]|eukprot:Sro70_g038880.1 Polyketide cyclase / dehydrase and lipid transport (195) ;mRNA; f:55607-56191